MTGRTASRIAVLALLKDDKVLLLQRSVDAAWMPGAWHVPGGRVEAGESVHEAAVREILEELGVEVAVEDLEFSGVVSYDKTDGEDADTFQFVAQRWQGEPSIMEPHKHQAMQWFTVNALPTNIPQHSRELLRDTRPAYVHAIDGVVRTVIT